MCYKFGSNFKSLQNGGGSKTKAQSISDLTKVNSDFKCICCQHFQKELEMALLELKIAKKKYRITTRRDKLHCTEHHCRHTRSKHLIWFECSKQYSCEEYLRQLEKSVLYQTEIKQTARCTTTTTNTDNRQLFLATR